MCWRGRSALPVYDTEHKLFYGGMIVGGFGAAVYHLNGNSIAGYDTVIVYGDPELAKDCASETGPTNILVLKPDMLLGHYGPFTPLVQAYVDLFNLPGWQAARFVMTLNERLLWVDAVA